MHTHTATPTGPAPPKKGGEDDFSRIDVAEANIRADYAANRITRQQFQKEMLIVSMARSYAAKAQS